MYVWNEEASLHMLMTASPPGGPLQPVYRVQFDVDDPLACDALQPGVFVQDVHVPLRLCLSNCIHLLLVHAVILELQNQKGGKVSQITR